MNRWWMGVTLLGLGLLPAMAWSQAPTIPSPVGPGRIPEPTPDYVAPPLVPGPLRTEMAPLGPDCDLDLPTNHSSAFQTETFPVEEAVWFNIGFQMLTRDKWGRLPMFYLDYQTNLDQGTIPPPVPAVGFVVDANNVADPVLWGLRGSLGYIINGRDAIEITGYTMFESSFGYDYGFQGRLNSFFSNIPLGFEGNNGMWLQADRVVLSRKVGMGNVELNYRYTSGAVTEPEIIVGMRYFSLVDQFGVYTGDDDYTFLSRPFLLPDRRRQATFDYLTRTRMVAPQLGVEWAPINTDIIKMGFLSKGAWGANFAQIKASLFRGDGFEGFNTSTSKVVFSQVYEITTFMDVCWLERFRMRAGYQVMWAVGVPDASSQFTFDLEQTGGRQSYSGSQFWHGPMLELQFLF